MGAELTGTEYYEAGAGEFNSMIERIFRDDPDGLFIAGGATEGAAIMRQLDELGYLDDVEILQHGLNTREFADLAGVKLIEGCCYGASGFVLDALDTEAQQFVKKNSKIFGSPPNEVVVYSYDAAMSLMRAIEVAGTVDDHAAIRDALAELTPEQYQPLNAIEPQDGRIFDDIGQIHPAYVVTHWVDGESVPAKE